MNNDNNPWIKRFERERSAKKAAEKLLEEKSLELYNVNQSLEKRVQERTIELEKALQKAKIAQKTKDNFLASMSHELRTPLNSIIGFSQILSRQKDVPPKLKGFIDNINISGNSLLQLINSILDFSKMESEEMSLEKKALNIEEFIDELIVLIEVEAEKKNIIISKKIEETTLIADKQLLGQAILNILANAVKFTPTNGNISIEVSENNNHIKIEICDNGIGILEENLKKIFDPFTQFENEFQTSTNGTGLGLYLTKKIITLHNAKIKIESEINKGTCFIISDLYSINH